jgi:hypothetical protein
MQGMDSSMRGVPPIAVGTVDGSTPSDYRIREVEARLDRRLSFMETRERQQRWRGRITGLALAVALSALAFVLWKFVPHSESWAVRSVFTEEIVLRDAAGVERGRLATDPEGRAQLSLADREGRERIRLTVLADGSPGVTISDPEARPRAVLGYLPDGTTNLVFADSRGTSRAVFGLEADGSTQALFADPSGAVRTVVGVGADGVPSVSILEDEAPALTAP